MAPSNETGVVRSIIKAIYERYPNAWHLTVHGSATQKTGVPDLLFCIHGRFFGFEVKHQKPNETEHAARSRTSIRQKIRLRQIRKAGGTAATVLSADEALELIDSTLHL